MADLTDSEKLLKDYLSSNNILIIDAISSGRTNIASCLAKFGAQRFRMTLVGSIQEAQEELNKTKPKMILADFMIGNESSLDLIQLQRTLHEQEKIKDSIFVLVTSNASQSAVAQAAEEDVDTFIIKPFALNTMKVALEEAVKIKLQPSFYLRLIDEGKELLFKGDYQSAIEKFKEAMDQHETPTLACFYYGQAEYMLKALDTAESKYLIGLSYNNIHYKCLVGLFDLMYQEKRYSDAYDVMKRLAQYFPANPKRLVTVLRLSIMTNNFKDVDTYYKIFVEMDVRSEELIRHMVSALAVTGRYYLRQKLYPRAIEFFENAAISSAGRVMYLLYIIEALVEYNLLKEAEPFVSRLQKVAPGSSEASAANFLTLDPAMTVQDVVNKGRSILKDGVEHASVYEKLIIFSIQAGYRDAALELANIASKKWPDRTKYFIRGFSAEELKQIGL
jgi:CheY-like chemotaxis protein